MRTEITNRRWVGYCLAIGGTALVTGVLKLFETHVNPTTVALALLLVILLVASGWGARPAVLASLLGLVGFNFFFLPPVGTFSIADPENWVALFAFLVTAVVAGRLSANAKRRAEEADAGRKEIERLYGELQNSFERTSEAKALQQSERLKSALLDAVTHDLRTPLTSIKASVTTLLNEKSDGERHPLDEAGRREMLDVINEESDRLDRFIEDLMELARIEAGEMQLRKHWASVEEIIAGALTRATPLTRRHKLESWLDDELPSVRVDERALAEVIYNLVDNAAKYSAPGTSIKVEARSTNGGTVQLSVSDEGPGIPAELRERVFDKFFRAMRDGDSASAPGTGMGLAIAKGIVEAHGGSIRVEDAAGARGTRVVISLPTGD